MMTAKEYLTKIQEAYDRTRAKSHDLAGSSPLRSGEELVSQLSMRGLLIVEVPVGTEHEFRGVPKAMIQ